MGRDASNRAMQHIAQGKLLPALEAAEAACKESPDDYHSWYALGITLRWLKRDAESLAALDRAHALNPDEQAVQLALAIARQRMGDFVGAIDVLRRALTADPDYVLGYNTLGMTQKLMGEPAKAAHNYAAGACALARGWARKLRNDQGNPRCPYFGTRNSLWLEYAAQAGMWLASSGNVTNIAFPDGAMAEDDARTGRFKGYYWEDSTGTPSLRLFTPNFLNTFAAHLRQDGAYLHLIGNRSTVLGILGQEEEARKHREEAEDFQQS